MNMTSYPRTQTKDNVEFYLQFSYCLRTGEPVIFHLLPAMERSLFVFRKFWFQISDRVLAILNDA